MPTLNKLLVNMFFGVVVCAHAQLSSAPCAAQCSLGPLGLNKTRVFANTNTHTFASFVIWLAKRSSSSFNLSQNYANAAGPGDTHIKR